MFIKEKIEQAQNALRRYRFDGWLLYDFRRSNPPACTFLEIPAATLLTRRFFYWIPKEGTPVKVVSAIEPHTLDHLPGVAQPYTTWKELESFLGTLLKGTGPIAMEYSPRNSVPYISLVDAGTVELIRSFGVEVVSSADILQTYTSVFDDAMLQSHLYAADVLDKTAQEAWDYIARALRQSNALSEYDVQQFILQRLQEKNCVTEGAPICAVNTHSANPHYCPAAKGSKTIRKGDFILIDLWCKQPLANSAYADITRVGVAASAPSSRQQAIFAVVIRARDAATQFVKDRFQESLPLQGWEVDRVCRSVIEEAGYGAFFIHRTGHSIDTSDHGSGANIDSYETQDTRHILPGTCFSIEPGIYLPEEFGVRLEYDLFVQPNGRVQITGGIQEHIVCLL